MHEYNIPRVFVWVFSSSDADTGLNAKVTSSLAQTHPTEQPHCPCISVNSENAYRYVLWSLDYKQVREIRVLVNISDVGLPTLSVNVPTHVVVVDVMSTGIFITYRVVKRKALKGGHMLYIAGNLQSTFTDTAMAETLPTPIFMRSGSQQA